MARKEENTQKILNSAINEFISNGVSASSMESIAKNAEVSKRTLYKYFPNKDKILDAIINSLLASVCNFSELTYSKTLSLEEQLTEIIDTKISLLTSDDYIKISKLVLSELLQSKTLSQEHLEQFNDSEQKFINWIDAAKKDGLIKSQLSSELMANQFHSIIKGQLFYPVIFGIKKINEVDVKNARDISKSFFLSSFTK